MTLFILDMLDRFRGHFPKSLYRISMRKFPKKPVQPVQPVQLLETDSNRTGDRIPIPLPPGSRTLNGEPYYLEDEKSPGVDDS